MWWRRLPHHSNICNNKVISQSLHRVIHANAMILVHHLLDTVIMFYMKSWNGSTNLVT